MLQGSILVACDSMIAEIVNLHPLCKKFIQIPCNNQMEQQFHSLAAGKQTKQIQDITAITSDTLIEIY